MPRMNGTGPDNMGTEAGRGLGRCNKVSTQEAGEKLGKGMGQRRHAGGGEGKGKRLKSSIK